MRYGLLRKKQSAPLSLLIFTEYCFFNIIQLNSIFVLQQKKKAEAAKFSLIHVKNNSIIKWKVQEN